MTPARRNRTTAAGRLLRTARQSRNLTLLAVALRAEVSITYLHDIEHGICGAPVATLVRIGRVLQVDMIALHNACARDVIASFEEDWGQAQ